MEKMIIRENYLKRIRPFYDSNYIKVITGIRRSGKSELLKQIIEEIKKMGIEESNIIKIDLEGKNGEGITTRKSLEKTIDRYIKNNDKYYIFIDEIQHIKKFEEAIASIRVSYNCSLFVTGSNSKLLHGKLQDRLTGRAKEFEILPFSYSEALEFKRLNNIEINDNDFYEYLENGGMPQRYEEIDDDGIKSYLIDLYSSIIQKDVFDNHPKINKNEFENVSKYIISTTGKLFSALSIAKYLKQNLSKDDQKKYSETINNYAKYLEECYFTLECKPFYLKGKEKLNGTKKYYAIDVGFKNALSNVLEFDDTIALENVIFNELKFRGYEVKYGKFRDGEIDFVAIKNKKKCLIQVSYDIHDDKTYQREFGAFGKINDYSPKYIFSLNRNNLSSKGVTHINIIDFLTNKTDIKLD